MRPDYRPSARADQLRARASLVTVASTRHMCSASFYGAFLSLVNKATDQLSHNHLHCTHGHCNNHIVTSFVFVLLAPIFITRRRRRVPCWTLAERKKSRTRGGAPCESRKTAFCVPLLWQAIPDQALAWLLGDVGETAKLSSAAGVHV